MATYVVLVFGDETKAVPGLRAVEVGTDADNTRGDSLGFIAQLEWTPGAAR